jgi:TPR repeat protein
VPAAEFAIIAAMRVTGSIAVFLLLAATAAHAQFYDLDGAYRCLKTPDAQCEKDLADQPTQGPPPPPPKPVAPDVGAAIAHVRDKTVGAKDIQTLTHSAEANDPRAVEVLAWCKLNGLGTARDPVAAYWLYRQAAALNVPHARENQIAVFEKQLTPEQRQQVLTEENSRKKP